MMLVGVIKDVEHPLPWIPGMEDCIKTGSLVVFKKGSRYCQTGEGVFWFIHEDSIEILGEL